MSLVSALGATSLGIVVGWLVRYFIRRFEKFTPAALTTVIGVVAGGAAVKFLSVDLTVCWFYPIGLLVGFVVYHITAEIEMNKEAKIRAEGVAQGGSEEQARREAKLQAEYNERGQGGGGGHAIYR